jgi:uncharacterized protein (DUF169 family)
MAPAVVGHPGTRPTEIRRPTVDESKSSAHARTIDPATRAGDPFAYAGERSHGCYGGWVYLGFDVEDENGEHAEDVQRVPCRRCHPEGV